MYYTLIINNLKINTTHGLLEEEKETPQEFLINIKVVTLFDETAAEKDYLPGGKCYAIVKNKFVEMFTEKHNYTLESLVYKISKHILESDTSHKSIEIEIIKTKLLKDCEVGIKFKLER